MERVFITARAGEARLRNAIKALRPKACENDMTIVIRQDSIEAGSKYLEHVHLVVPGRLPNFCFPCWKQRPMEKGTLCSSRLRPAWNTKQAILAKSAVLRGWPVKMRKFAEALNRALDGSVT